MFSLKWKYEQIQGLAGLSSVSQTLLKLLNSSSTQVYVNGYLERANRDLFPVSLTKRSNAKKFLALKTEMFLLQNLTGQTPSLVAWVGLLFHLMGVSERHSIVGEQDVQRLVQTKTVNPSQIAQLFECYSTRPVGTVDLMQDLLVKIKVNYLSQAKTNDFARLLGVVTPDAVSLLSAMIAKRPVSFQAIMFLLNKPIVAKIFNFVWRLRLNLPLNWDEFSAFENQDTLAVYGIKLTEVAAMYALLKGELTIEVLNGLLGQLPESVMRSIQGYLFFDERNAAVTSLNFWQGDALTFLPGNFNDESKEIFSAAFLLSKGLTGRLRLSFPFFHDFESLHENSRLVDLICDLGRLRQILTAPNAASIEHLKERDATFMWLKSGDPRSPFASLRGPLSFNPLFLQFLNPHAQWDRSTLSHLVNAFFNDDVGAWTLLVALAYKYMSFDFLVLNWETYFASSIYKAAVELSSKGLLPPHELEFFLQNRTAAIRRHQAASLEISKEIRETIDNTYDAFDFALILELLPDAHANLKDALLIKSTEQLITKFLSKYVDVTCEKIVHHLRTRMMHMHIDGILEELGNLASQPEWSGQNIKHFMDFFFEFITDELVIFFQKLGSSAKGPRPPSDRVSACICESFGIEGGLFLLTFLKSMSKIPASTLPEREQSYPKLVSVANGIFELIDRCMLFCDCGIFTSKFQAIQLFLLSLGIVIHREDMLMTTPQIFRPETIRQFKLARSPQSHTKNSFMVPKSNGRPRSTNPQEPLPADRESLPGQKISEVVDATGTRRRGNETRDNFLRTLTDPERDDTSIRARHSFTPENSRNWKRGGESSTPKPRSTEGASVQSVALAKRLQLFRFSQQLTNPDVPKIYPESELILEAKPDFWDFRQRIQQPTTRDGLKMGRQEYFEKVKSLGGFNLLNTQNPWVVGLSSPVDPILLEIYDSTGGRKTEEALRLISLYYPMPGQLENWSQFANACFKMAEKSCALTLESSADSHQMGIQLSEQTKEALAKLNKLRRFPWKSGMDFHSLGLASRKEALQSTLDYLLNHNYSSKFIRVQSNGRHQEVGAGAPQVLRPGPPRPPQPRQKIHVSSSASSSSCPIPSRSSATRTSSGFSCTS